MGEGVRRLELPALLKVHPLSLSTESSTKARQNFFLPTFSFLPLFLFHFPRFFSFFFGLPSSLILSTQMQNNYFTFSLVFRFTAPPSPQLTAATHLLRLLLSPPPSPPSSSSWGNPFAGSGCRNLCTFPSSFYLFFAFFCIENHFKIQRQLSYAPYIPVYIPQTLYIFVYYI